ncbi:MAG: phosphate ABC transporter permease subunit PstC [Rhodobacteraceae bacterium]|nr:phosphate ABC transporter permease subunit PstC [Paracoccaceae bacterium]
MPLTISISLVLALIALLAIVGFFIGRARAISVANGVESSLHSLPKQHGMHVALAASVPALIFIILWSIGSGIASNSYTASIIDPNAPELQLSADVTDGLPQDEIDVRLAAQRDLFVANVKGLAVAIDGYIANGNATEADVEGWRVDFTPLAQRLRDDGQIIGANISQKMFETALRLRGFNATIELIGRLGAVFLAIGGFLYGLKLINRDFRARISVERWILAFLIFASTIAILTTVGILSAITFPTLAFFKEYGIFNFLFGMEWAPAGDVAGAPEGPDGSYVSALGFLPLIWGTLYIALVALLVAVPLGLSAAIYLSEFAPSALRATIKPALEILAGIPTIVYGIFALVTVGPFLQAVVGSTIMPNTVSVLTAGVVMGMMLVPFVSSLSDDVINAVPQAMRDGSLGLGATPAETVTKVILPAALPGIVGAIVLAASRAIGETMIVVLAAGALSSVTGLEPNPFGAVVTVTTRIVAVLTGEGSGFDSIDVLAVFALAFTLFFVTLGLNLLAQRIVAKYREQYD